MRNNKFMLNFIFDLISTQFYIVTGNIARLMSLTKRPIIEVKLVLKVGVKRKMSRENYNLRNKSEGICGSVENEVAQK